MRTRRRRRPFQIATLKLTLDGVRPPVRRRLAVPLAFPLDALHEAIQAAMGWTAVDRFFVRARGTVWGTPGVWSEDIEIAKGTHLDEVLARVRVKTITYGHDVEDGWDLTITVERVEPGDPDAAWPRLLEAVGAAPPETCGGPAGYAALRAALADPADARHAEALAALGPGHDPRAADATVHEAALAAVAARWPTSFWRRDRLPGEPFVVPEDLAEVYAEMMRRLGLPEPAAGPPTAPAAEACGPTRKPKGTRARRVGPPAN